MAFNKTEFVMTRLASRSFLLPFSVVTILFLMNISIVAIFGKSYAFITQDPIFSYGAMTALYLMCVLESLGLSLFAKLACSLLRRSK